MKQNLNQKAKPMKVNTLRLTMRNNKVMNLKDT